MAADECDRTLCQLEDHRGCLCLCSHVVVQNQRGMCLVLSADRIIIIAFRVLWYFCATPQTHHMGENDQNAGLTVVFGLQRKRTRRSLRRSPCDHRWGFSSPCPITVPAWFAHFELMQDAGRRTRASRGPAEATRDPATTPAEALRAHRGGPRRHRNRDLAVSSTHHFLKSTACGFPCVIGPVAFLGRMSYL